VNLIAGTGDVIAPADGIRPYLTGLDRIGRVGWNGIGQDDDSIRIQRWPAYNRSLLAVVEAMTDAQLAIQPSPERWPLWATVGHIACQRVSGLCGLAGEPGAESTPFPNALFSCPGDEYLEPVMSGVELVGALESTFGIVEACLDSWTLDTLDDEIHRTFESEKMVYTRGGLIQRSLAHDVYHCAELNETLGRHGLPMIEVFD
jgi:hypothetical protein